MIKNDYKSFDMNIDKSTPQSIFYLPIYLPTHPSIKLITSLPAILQLAYYLPHSLVVIWNKHVK